LDLSIKYVSPSVEALSGYTPEEVIKLGPKNLMTPESFEKGVADFKEAIQMMQKTQTQSFHIGVTSTYAKMEQKGGENLRQNFCAIQKAT